MYYIVAERSSSHRFAYHHEATDKRENGCLSS